MKVWANIICFIYFKNKFQTAFQVVLLEFYCIEYNFHFLYGDASDIEFFLI